MKNANRILQIGLGAVLAGQGLTCVYADEVSEETSVLKTVTVTGEKVDRSLQETTSSVTVIPEEKIEGVQYRTISEVVSEVSNVVVTSGSVPDIRGVSGNGSAGGFNSISGGANPRVSTLVDGVAEPFVADLTGDSGLWDIRQIELFRGPQSTSNGRNSIGGSIIITTQDPTFDWQAAGRVGYRNQEQFVDTSAMVSGPIVEDTLAFRITAQRTDGETLTSEEQFDTNPADYDLNEVLTERVRAKLLWTPTDQLKTLLTYSSNNESGDTGRVYYAADDPWDYQRIYFRDIDTDADTTSLKVNYEVSDSLSFEVLGAYVDYQWGFESYEPSSAAEQQLVFDEEDQTLDVKINMGNQQGVVYGFLGLAYFERSQDFESTGAFAYFGDDESDSEALYGELTYAVTDAFRVVAGGRVQRESQVRNFNYNNGQIISVLDEEETISLPKLALLYDVTASTTLGLSARKGYNSPGGALNFAAGQYYYFDEETVDTYEATLRSQLSADTYLSANLFFNEYEGYQALSSSRYITNMDEVVTYGAELEAVTRLGGSLDVTAGLGLLRTEIKDAGAGFADATGNELNSAPEITANLGAKYWLNDAFNVGAAANYVDEYFGDFENTEERIAGNYTLVNFTANYEVENWLVSAFVNNAFDKRAFTLREPPGGRYPAGYVAIVEPRNVGLSITYFL
ncbi:MAG: TonB-dependent receptor [Ketobacter sp.]|nr:MAG: TonB-dependent receptor [Ketobacter sp.]